MPCRITFPNVTTWSFRTRWHSESQFPEEWVKGGTRPSGGAKDVETSFWCQISPKINTEVKILNSSEGLLQNTLYLIDNVDSERQHTLECQPVSINPPEGRQWSVTHVCCMEILLVVTNMAVSSVNQSHQKHIDSMLSYSFKAWGTMNIWGISKYHLLKALKCLSFAQVWYFTPKIRGGSNRPSLELSLWQRCSVCFPKLCKVFHMFTGTIEEAYFLTPCVLKLDPENKIK